MEENKRMKEEINDIIHELDDLPKLQEEYEKLNKDNLILKEKLKKMANK